MSRKYRHRRPSQHAGLRWRTSVVRGTDGTDGSDGSDGTDGTDGSDGSDGTDE